MSALLSPTTVDVSAVGQSAQNARSLPQIQRQVFPRLLYAVSSGSALTPPIMDFHLNPIFLVAPCATSAEFRPTGIRVNSHLLPFRLHRRALTGSLTQGRGYKD